MYWVEIKLAQKKGFKFYQTRSNAIILYNTLPAYCIPKPIKMETGEINTKKYLNHLGRLRRFPLKIIGWRNWVQKLLDMVKAPNKPNQIQIQLLEQGNLFWQNIRPVPVLRKSTNVFYLAAKAPMRLLNVQIKTKTQTKTKTQVKLKRRDPLEVNNLSICSHNVEK